MEQKKSVKRLVNEKATSYDGSRENSLPPVELTFVRSKGNKRACELCDPACIAGRAGVGGNSQQDKPRPCICSSLRSHNRFPALTKVNSTGWGLRDGYPLLVESVREQVLNNSGIQQSLIYDKNLTSYRPNVLTTIFVLKYCYEIFYRIVYSYNLGACWRLLLGRTYSRHGLVVRFYCVDFGRFGSEFVL